MKIVNACFPQEPPRSRRWTWNILGGIGSILALWVLASVEPLEVFLYAPLRIVHGISWEAFGFKIIPDGDGSTCFVSAYFFGFGFLVVTACRWASRACQVFAARSKPQMIHTHPASF